MIKVIIHKNETYINAFQISGHANSGPYGYDLVCAAVSAVSFGAVNAVMKLCEIELLIEQASDGGYLSVKLPPSIPNETAEKASLIFEAMLISLQTIENEYRQFIKISS